MASKPQDQPNNAVTSKSSDPDYSNTAKSAAAVLSMPTSQPGSSLQTPASSLAKPAAIQPNTDQGDTTSTAGSHSALEVAAASFLSNLQYAASRLDAQDSDGSADASDPALTLFSAAQAQGPPASAQGVAASLLTNSGPQHHHHHQQQQQPFPQLAVSQSMFMLPPHVQLQHLPFQPFQQLQQRQQYQPLNQQKQGVQPSATQRLDQPCSSEQLPTKRAKQGTARQHQSQKREENHLHQHQHQHQQETRPRSRRPRKKPAAAEETPQNTRSPSSASASPPTTGYATSAKTTKDNASTQHRRRTSSASRPSVSATDEAYKLKRARNNEAVRKCRIKKKLEMEAKEKQLNMYKQQVEQLTLQVQHLKRQLAERRVCVNCGIVSAGQDAIQLSSPASPGTTSASHSPSA